MTKVSRSAAEMTADRRSRLRSARRRCDRARSGWRSSASASSPTLADFSPVTGYLRQDLSAAFQDEIRAEEPFRTPFNRMMLVGVQRALLPDLAASLTYVHRSMKNILGLAFNSRTVGAPVTTDGGPLLRTYGAFYDAKYDGWIVAVEKRFRDRYQFQANYTYAKATDNPVSRSRESSSYGVSSRIQQSRSGRTLKSSLLTFVKTGHRVLNE